MNNGLGWLTVHTAWRRASGENHHLWRNHGTWYISVTIYPSHFTKERFRASLQTHEVVEARLRRDKFLSAMSVYGDPEDALAACGCARKCGGPARRLPFP
ncbi:MAG: hypothetical protein KF715_19625 [Candidatus Didemnitutus sp.]|nr:hypothetical protein [Candidatus Didemnitutus sp.]